MEANIAAMLKEYAEFLESPPGYVVTEILRKAFRKDKAFAQWKQGRENSRTDTIRPKVGRRSPQADLPAVAAS